MAHIIPTDLTRLTFSNTQGLELGTLHTLKASLPDDYTIFHGIHWTREYHAWTHFGEIDFVVLNRSGDLLFIEQKNGALSEDADGLSKSYEEDAKDPVAQIHRSINKVRDKFQWRHGKDRKLQIDYLVYLPDYRVRDINAAGLDASRIIDAPHRETLAARIQELLGPGIAGDDGWYDTVHEFFCQSFQVVADMQAHRDNWYLDAWCHLRAGLRSFAVDAIRVLTPVAARVRNVADKILDAKLGTVKQDSGVCSHRIAFQPMSSSSTIFSYSLVRLKAGTDKG